VVGTARCAVRAAYSGATCMIRASQSIRSARWTWPGTSQRDVPTYSHALNSCSVSTLEQQAKEQSPGGTPEARWLCRPSGPCCLMILNPALKRCTCLARERGCVRRTSRSAPLQDLVVLRAARLGHAATGLSGTVALRREARAKRWARLVCPSGTETRR